MVAIPIEERVGLCSRERSETRLPTQSETARRRERRREGNGFGLLDLLGLPLWALVGSTVVDPKGEGNGLGLLDLLGLLSWPLVGPTVVDPKENWSLSLCLYAPSLFIAGVKLDLKLSKLTLRLGRA